MILCNDVIVYDSLRCYRIFPVTTSSLVISICTHKTPERLYGFSWNLVWYYACGDHFRFILFNFLQSVIPTWRMMKLWGGTMILCDDIITPPPSCHLSVTAWTIYHVCRVDHLIVLPSSSGCMNYLYCHLFVAIQIIWHNTHWKWRKKHIWHFYVLFTVHLSNFVPFCQVNARCSALTVVQELNFHQNYTAYHCIRKIARFHQISFSKILFSITFKLKWDFEIKFSLPLPLHENL
jgi:hypothetical protein